MNSVIRAAAKVQLVLEKYGWKFCFICGIAVQKWGQARFTQDVGLTILTALGGEEPIIDEPLHRRRSDRLQSLRRPRAGLVRCRRSHRQAKSR